MRIFRIYFIPYLFFSAGDEIRIKYARPYACLLPGLYPSTFADPRFRKEHSVLVTHEC